MFFSINGILFDTDGLPGDPDEEGLVQISNGDLKMLIGGVVKSLTSQGHEVVVKPNMMPQRAILYFAGMGGEDEPVDELTIVTFPRALTTAQRIAETPGIAFDGCIVYDTDLKKHLRYVSGTWRTML